MQSVACSRVKAISSTADWSERRFQSGLGTARLPGRRIRMIWKPELDELTRREAFAREMGGVEKVKRQRDHGRLTVRERIDKMVDADSFHEIGAVSGVGEY